MGIILGALAGAGGQAIDLADKSIAQDQKLEAMGVENDLAIHRAQALELFKEGRTDALREQRNTRIGAAAETVADRVMDPKLQQEQAGIVDRASWTPEQQAAVDQSNAIDRKGIVAKAKYDGSAAIESGDIDPKDAATLNNKSDALLYKTLYEQSKEDGRNARADARTQASIDNADNRNAVMMRGQDMRLKAMLEHFQKTGSGNPNREALTFLSDSRKSVASEATDIRQQMKIELENARGKGAVDEIKKSYAPKLDKLEKQRRALDDDFNALRAKVGLPPAKAEPTDDGDASPPAAAPAPGATPAASAASSSMPAGVPPGARQIGTSGGKPVYQLPDGSKVMAQ